MHKSKGRLPTGKLPIETLRRLVLSKLPSPEELVVRPGIGIDFAAIRLRDGSHLLVSSDPITGADDVGWYGVHVACNDVATSGAPPRYLEMILMMREGAEEEEVRSAMKGALKAAQEVGVKIIGGHTECTPGLNRSLACCTAFSIAERFVTASSARPEDLLVMTKGAAMEGTSILAQMLLSRGGKGLDERLLKRAVRMKEQISIVKEAIEAFRVEGVHAMHDVTEGGVLGAALEMAKASGLGLEVYEKEVHISKETGYVASLLGVDPLKLIGSGSLLIAVKEERLEELLEAIRRLGIEARPMGRFLKRKAYYTIGSDGGRKPLREVVDELWRIEARLKMKEEEGEANVLGEGTWA